MEERPAKRVTVTHPRTAAARSSARRSFRGDVREQTPLGVTMITSLRRAQLRLAVIVGTGLVVVLGGIPVVFLAVPGLRELRVGGLSLGWIVLGLLVFPAICGAAWWYVRAAERTEAEFVDLVERS
jgi:hypothetical protein